MRRQEALVFLRMAVEEIALRDADNSLQDIAQTQADAGDVPAAVETVKAIKDPFYRGCAWVAIATAQFRAGDRPGGRESLMFAIKETDDPANASRERDIVLSEVAATQADDGAIEEASRTAQAITGPSYRITAWNAVAIAQARGGDLASCRRSIAMATEVARGIVSDPTSSGMDSRIRAWDAVAVARAKTGDTAGRDESFALAVEAAQAIERGEHVIGQLDKRIDGLVEVAEEQFRAGDLTGRDRTFALAQDTAHKLPEAWEERTRGILTVTTRQALFGDVAGATAAMKEIGNDDRDDVLGAQAEFQAKQGGLREAVTLAQTIKSAGWRARVFLQIASAREDTGDTAGQREALTLALQAAREIPDADGRASMLGRVAAAQASADPAGAILTLDGKWAEEYLDAWEEIALAKARAGDIAGAKRIARRLRPKRDLWWTRWWNHHWDQFLTAVGRPRSTAAGYSDDNALDNWSLAVCGIAAAQARTGDRQAAIATIQELPRDRSGNSLYRRVGRDLLKYPTKLIEF